MINILAVWLTLLRHAPASEFEYYVRDQTEVTTTNKSELLRLEKVEIKSFFMKNIQRPQTII